MRSILTMILLWSLVTCALSLLAYRAISRALEWRGPRENDPFWRMSVMVEEDLRREYEEGGPGRLAAWLQRHDSYLPVNIF
jgi:hypothetical protein